LTETLCHGGRVSLEGNGGGRPFREWKVQKPETKKLRKLRIPRLPGQRRLGERRGICGSRQKERQNSVFLSVRKKKKKKKRTLRPVASCWELADIDRHRSAHEGGRGRCFSQCCYAHKRGSSRTSEKFARKAGKA